MAYQIAEMLNRIRNAQAVGIPATTVPFSKMNMEIAKILEKKDFIGKTDIKKKRLGLRKIRQKSEIEIILKYTDKAPAISGLKLVSRSGQRIYIGWKDIKRVKAGFGLAIISTSKGLMTDSDARKQKLGGEIICEIW